MLEAFISLIIASSTLALFIVVEHRIEKQQTKEEALENTSNNY